MPTRSNPTDPFAASGDSTADTPTTAEAESRLNGEPAPSDADYDAVMADNGTTTANGGNGGNGGNGEDFDPEETRVRYLERGDPADILALLDHYTGRSASTGE